MRRTVATVIALVAALTSAACEDGPSQTYTPEPPGAGNVINGPGGGPIFGDGGTFVTPATQGFDASSGGQNASQLCTAAQQKQVWANNFNAPIIVPGLAGGLDIAGGYPGTGGIAAYDPMCLSYKDCNGGPLTPKYEPTTLPPPYWTNPAYDPNKESWTGMTVEQAEGLLCQPENATAIFGGDYPQINWGEQGEFGVLYTPSSRLISAFLLLNGYNGLIEATNKLSNTTYTISMQNVFMQKSVNGGAAQNITLNWTDGTLPGIVNDMYEAFRETFTPNEFPAEKDCLASGHCELQNNGIDDGILIFNPLNLAIFVSTTVGTPSANSIPIIIQLGVLKVLPFSNSAVTLQLDPQGVGPTAITTGLGSADGGGGSVTCDYHLGMLYGDPNTPGTFQHDCVQPVAGGASNPINAENQTKLLGALSHDDETYAFSTSGVDPQFAAYFPPGSVQVVADGQLPGPKDVAYELTIDQSILGAVTNDYTNNDSTQAQDWHGIGLVTLEWANLVQQYLQANYGVTANLGDPACIANPVRPPLPDGGVYPAGTKICSGLEGIVTTAPPALAPASMAPNALGAAGVSVNQGNPNCTAAAVQARTCNPSVPAPTNGITLGLKPGTWVSLFCSDAGGLDGTGTPVGYTTCIGAGNAAYQGFYFDTMQQAVANSYGTLPVPGELANRRFFFKEWMFAMVKYLETANVPTTTLAQIDANVYDPDGLFFDAFGGQGSGFEFGQYDDRLTVNSDKQAPTALTVSTNLLTGLINTITFDRYNFRGDTAIFSALQDTPADLAGAETMYVSNLASAPVLQNVYGTYACATNTQAVTTAANCPCGGATSVLTDAGAPVTADGGPMTVDGGPPGGQDLVNCPLGPLDEFGNELYAPYADAFGATILNIPYLNGPTEDVPSGITIDSSSYALIQSALVTLPIIVPPASYAGAVPPNTKTISELLPFLQGATVGFPITIDGSRDKFYNTFNVDFSAGGSVTGQPVSFNLDYEYVPAGSQNLVVRAIETQNFFGAVFPCFETNPATGAVDVLGVRMYDNGANILGWIAAHPAATNDCGIQIKFSIYGNYADYISFGINPGESISGTRIGLNPGFGGSVVSDVTIFDPNVVASLGM
jgi:hypothetical protein